MPRFKLNPIAGQIFNSPAITKFSFLNICLTVLIFSLPYFGQQDPNPNSPAPVLIRFEESGSLLKNVPALPVYDSKDSVKNLSSRVLTFRLYSANVELINGEGANAFRVYLEDEFGRTHRSFAAKMEQVSAKPDVFSLVATINRYQSDQRHLSEKLKFSARVSLRGMISKSEMFEYDAVRNEFIQVSEKSEFIDNEFDTKSVSDDSEFVGYKYSGDRIRFLEQATFGPTPELEQRLRRIGPNVWIADQFTAAYPETNNPYPVLPLKSSVRDVGCSIYLPAEEKRICDRDFYSMYPVQNWFFKEALYGNSQLRHRVAWALSQIWVISGKTTQQASHMIAYHKVLSENAFGNYRELMKEMTLNPGMGNYLDMARSHAFSPNENYAREILQLFTIGLFRLNTDGTRQLDQAGQPIATFDQQTVNNFTKIFTGWTFCNDGTNPACPRAVVGTVNFIDPMLLVPEAHDPNSKVLLNYPNAVNRDIPAGQNGNTDLEQALDNIFYHPNVGPFVGRILIQHLVTSDPTPAYVGRVASAFNDNGSGVRGDMKSVIRGVLLDPEARGDFKTDPYYGKLREPVTFMTNILRNNSVRSADRTQNSDGVLAAETKKMGQDLFYSTTVFNYFAPGYIIPGTSSNAPEFGVMTTSTAISRTNLVNRFTFGKVFQGLDIPLGTSIDLNGLIQLSAADHSGVRLVNELDRMFMHFTMSQSMRDRILTSVLAVPSDQPEIRARNAFFLVASSSQFQIQR